MTDARPEEWPRCAPVVLTLLAVGAAGVAIGVVASAAGRPLASALAAAGALAGALATGLAVAYVRYARRTARWSATAMVTTLLISFFLTLGVALVAAFADGTFQAAALAILAGAVFGMTVGSLLWRRSVMRAQPRRSITGTSGAH